MIAEAAFELQEQSNVSQSEMADGLSLSDQVWSLDVRVVN